MAQDSAAKVCRPESTRSVLQSRRQFLLVRGKILARFRVPYVPVPAETTPGYNSLQRGLVASVSVFAGGGSGGVGVGALARGERTTRRFRNGRKQENGVGYRLNLPPAAATDARSRAPAAGAAHILHQLYRRFPCPRDNTSHPGAG